MLDPVYESLVDSSICAEFLPNGDTELHGDPMARETLIFLVLGPPFFVPRLGEPHGRRHHCGHVLFGRES